MRDGPNGASGCVAAYGTFNNGCFVVSAQWHLGGSCDLLYAIQTLHTAHHTQVYVLHTEYLMDLSFHGATVL